MAEYDEVPSSQQTKFDESLKTVDLSNVDSIEDFKNLQLESKELLIYNAWSDVENLYRTYGTSKDTVDLLNALPAKESYHLADRTNLAFHLEEMDLPNITNPDTKEKIEAYRGNLVDSWNPPSVATDFAQTRGLDPLSSNNQVS